MNSETPGKTTLAKRLVRWLGSLAGRGGRGTASLGTAPAGASATEQEREQYYRCAARLRFPGKRILVLEDNEACCEILRNFMARWEMEVTILASCREAYKAIEARQPYDFAVLDHTLGDGTGDEVARAMRSAGLCAKCSMVSLTGNRYLPDRTLYDATIEKPISPETLRATLIDLMDARTGNLLRSPTA